MQDNKQNALIDLWEQCFPNWREEVELEYDIDSYDEEVADEIDTDEIYTDAELLFNVFRFLVPVESDICTGSHNPDDPQIDPPADPQLCPDGITDPAYMIE